MIISEIFQHSNGCGCEFASLKVGTTDDIRTVPGDDVRLVASKALQIARRVFIVVVCPNWSPDDSSFAEHRHPIMDFGRLIVSSSDGDDSPRQTIRGVKNDKLSNAVPIISFRHEPLSDIN